MNTNPHISIVSRALHWLGAVFIGSPDSLQMPASFYHLDADRPKPTSDELENGMYQRNAIGCDTFRRELTRRVALAASAASAAVVLVIALIAPSQAPTRPSLSAPVAGAPIGSPAASSAYQRALEEARQQQ